MVKQTVIGKDASSLAPLVSPTFTGVPAAPTAAVGTNTTQLATTAFVLANAGGVPSGSIALWNGSIATIPSGYVLCNGSNSTPNLMDKFVVGAGSTYAVAATGGEATHALSIAELAAHTHTQPTHTHTGSQPTHTHTASQPAHTHAQGAYITSTTYGPAADTGLLWSRMSITNTGSGGDDAVTVNAGGNDAVTVAAGGGDATGSNGSGTAHENRPPYYALAYIMKT